MSEGTLLMSRPEALTLVRRIHSGMENVRVALLDLEEREGWRAMGYESWVVCVQKEFGQSASQIYRLLNAGQIDRILHSPIGEEIPESHARELAPLKSDPGAVREVYAEAGPKPTAVRIRSAVEKRRPDAKPKGKPKHWFVGEDAYECEVCRKRMSDEVHLRNQHGSPVTAVEDYNPADGGFDSWAYNEAQEVLNDSPFMAGVHEALVEEAAGVQPRTIEQITAVPPEIAVEYSGYIAALAFDQPDPMGFVKALQPGFLRSVRDNIGPAIAWLQRVEILL